MKPGESLQSYQNPDEAPPGDRKRPVASRDGWASLTLFRGTFWWLAELGIFGTWSSDFLSYGGNATYER